MNAVRLTNEILDRLIELDDENEISSEDMIKATTAIAAKTMQQLGVAHVDVLGVRLTLESLSLENEYE